MFFKKKTSVQLSEEEMHQQQLINHALQRISEKKNFVFHCILFLLGSVFFIFINLLLKIGIQFRPFDLDWFVYVVLIWLFVLLVHFSRVFVLSKFMGKDWKDQQMRYLLRKQELKIQKMKNKLDLQVPIEIKSTKTILLDNSENSSSDKLK